MSTAANRGVAWRAVLCYYPVALLIALPFNLGWFAPWFADHLPGTPLAIWPFLPAALGPALGAALASRLLPPGSRRTSFFGTSVRRSLATAAVPVVAFAFLGAESALLALVAILYAVGEEVGWRGVLRDALTPLAQPLLVVFTGLLWWFWHLRFSSGFDLTWFLVIIIVSSAVLNHAAKITGSWLVPAAMHALMILLTGSGASGRPAIIAAAATVAAWIVMGRIWPHPVPGNELQQDAVVTTQTDGSAVE